MHHSFSHESFVLKLFALELKVPYPIVFYLLLGVTAADCSYQLFDFCIFSLDKYVVRLQIVILLLF